MFSRAYDLSKRQQYSVCGVTVKIGGVFSINEDTPLFGAQLYEGYYGKFLKDNIINQNKNLCATAGIISFLIAINLDHLEILIPVFEALGISEKAFIDYTHQLHELELVDIYNDKVVKISDQCLGNYLLEYVFMKEKIIPFSIMVKACFQNYKPRVVNATNVLGNIFASRQMKNIKIIPAKPIENKKLRVAAYRKYSVRFQQAYLESQGTKVVMGKEIWDAKTIWSAGRNRIIGQSSPKWSENVHQATIYGEAMHHESLFSSLP